MPQWPRHVGEQPLDMRAGMHEAAFARALRRGPAGIQAVGRGDGEKSDIAAVLGHQADRLDRFRRDRARIGDHDLAIRARHAQPIGAVDDLLAQLRRHRALDLLNRPGREPQIDRAAGLVAQPVAFGRLAVAVLLDVGEAQARIAASSSTKAGSNAASPSCAMPISGSAIDWCAPPSRRQRDARRRRHHDEAGVLVAGVVERIEPARDEGIVQRADRQQPLAVDGVRQAERRQQDEQVHLGDAELDMLALRREFPVEGRRDALALERVGHAPRARTARGG